MKKTYMGVSQCFDGSGGQVVNVIGPGGTKRLPLCLNIRNHSPTGFQWGYGGSGPAQLALALLVDCLGDKERALRLYQRFKFRVVGAWPMGQPWTISEDEIRKIVDELDVNRAAG